MSYDIGLFVLTSATMLLISTLFMADPIWREITRLIAAVLIAWVLFVAITTTPHIVR